MFQNGGPGSRHLGFSLEGFPRSNASTLFGATNSNTNNNEQPYSPASHHDTQPDQDSGMDWLSPSTSHEQHFDDANFSEMPTDTGDLMEFDDLDHSESNGTGIRTHVPPLPPRPGGNMSTSVGTHSSLSSQYTTFNPVNDNLFSSPVTSPTDSVFGSFPRFNRVNSPFGTPSLDASSSFVSMGSYSHINSMHSPGVGGSSNPFGSFGPFVSHHQTQQTVVGSKIEPQDTADRLGSGAMTPTAISVPGSRLPVGGTPGFEIWKAPSPPQIKAEPSIASPRLMDTPALPQRPVTNSQGVARPPVPTKPKALQLSGNPFGFSSDGFKSSASRNKGKEPATAAGPAIISPQPIPNLIDLDTDMDSSITQHSMPSPSSAFKIEEDSDPSVMSLPEVPTLPSMSTLAAGVASPAPIRLDSQPPMDDPSKTNLPDGRPANFRTARPAQNVVTVEAWEYYKDIIRCLYLDERKPLKEVISIMIEKHGFTATPKMYKTRFSQWGFAKNNTQDEIKRLLSMKYHRDAQGKVTEFVRNGKVINIATYLRRKGVTEYDLGEIDECPANSDLPDYIRCRTPTPPLAPALLRSPDLVRVHEVVVTNIRKALLECRHHELENKIEVNWSEVQVWGMWASEMLLEANFFLEAGDAESGNQSMTRAFGQLEQDLKTLTPASITELLLSMINRDLSLVTSLTKYLAAYCSSNYEQSHPIRKAFAALYSVQQKHGSQTVSEFLFGTMKVLADELESIYTRQHPYVARLWIDLSLFYNYTNTSKAEKLVVDLRASLRKLEAEKGEQDPDVLTLRYSILQLLYAIGPHADRTKQAAMELWTTLRAMGVMHPMRDPRPNAYCYHSPVRLDPWSKRCRRRYESGVAIFEEHIGVKVHPYFEEDFHTATHAGEAYDSWMSAIHQQAQAHRFQFM